MMIGSSS
jgi:hypothetical protein